MLPLYVTLTHNLLFTSPWKAFKPVGRVPPCRWSIIYASLHRCIMIRQGRVTCSSLAPGSIIPCVRPHQREVYTIILYVVVSLAGLVATPSSCCMTSIFHWATFHPTFVSSTASNFLKKHEFHGLTLCLSTLCQYGFLISLSISLSTI